MRKFYRFATLTTITATMLIGLLTWPGLVSVAGVSPAKLDISKTVTPPGITRNGEVTYTISLTNTGAAVTGVSLTDTLPISVTFARWVARPAGAGVSGNVLTWSGPLTAGQAITFSFVAGHTGSYGEVVMNRVVYSAAVTGAAAATFTVASAPIIYLPLVAKAPPTNSMAQYVLQPGDVPAGYDINPNAAGVMTFTVEMQQFHPVEGFQVGYVNYSLLFSGPFVISNDVILFPSPTDAHNYLEFVKQNLATDPGFSPLPVVLGDEVVAYQWVTTEDNITLVINIIYFRKGNMISDVFTGGLFPVAADYNFTLSLAQVVLAKMER